MARMTGPLAVTNEGAFLSTLSTTRVFLLLRGSYAGWLWDCHLEVGYVGPEGLWSQVGTEAMPAVEEC